MVCSTLKLKTWYDLLIWELEEVVNYEELLDSDEPGAQMTTVLLVEAKELHYMQPPGIYSSDFRMKQLQHMHFAQCFIQF